MIHFDLYIKCEIIILRFDSTKTTYHFPSKTFLQRNFLAFRRQVHFQDFDLIWTKPQIEKHQNPPQFVGLLPKRAHLANICLNVCLPRWEMHVELSGMQVLLTELSPPSSPYSRLLAPFITLQHSFPHWSWGISLSATSGILLGLLLLCQIVSFFPIPLPSQSQCSCKCWAQHWLSQLCQDLPLLGEFHPAIFSFLFVGLGFFACFCFVLFSRLSPTHTFLEMLLDFLCFLQHAPSPQGAVSRYNQCPHWSCPLPRKLFCFHLKELCHPCAGNKSTSYPRHGRADSAPATRS